MWLLVIDVLFVLDFSRFSSLCLSFRILGLCFAYCLDLLGLGWVKVFDCLFCWFVIWCFVCCDLLFWLWFVGGWTLLL